MAATGMAVVVFVGAWSTAEAVVDGDLAATFVRFTAAILAGAYFRYLLFLARGGRLFPS